MKIYLFYFTEDYFDGYDAISFHKTKKGAYMAMREYIVRMYESWYDQRIRHGKFDRGSKLMFEDWRYRIKSVDLLE